MPDRKRKSVMLMIGGNESEAVQLRLLLSGLVLAKYISADLDVCVPNLEYWPNSKLFSRLKKAPQFKVEVTAFGKNSNFVDEVKARIQVTNPILFIMDRSHLTQIRTNQERLLQKKLISDIHIPILLVMCQRRELRIPFLSLFVPMSGEVRASPALEWSLKFANEMHLPVDILHVTHQNKGITFDPSLIGKICDEFYHEYPHLISNFVAQGSPYSSMREKEVIRHFIHCTGLELDEIIKCGYEESRPLVVVEWKGNLSKGHAKVLKGILAQTDWPILLTRQKSNHGVHLKSLRKLRAA